MSTYYSGRVNAVVWANPAQDFYILKMVLDEGTPGAPTTPVSVRGSVPGMSLAIGSWFGFEAQWETHEKYGKQLVITKAPVLKDKWTPEVALAMLSAHGVGERVCKSLGSHFGTTLVEALDADDEASLRDIPGMTPFAATHVLSRWKMVKAFFQTLAFLSDAGVPKAKIGEVWTTFGEDAERVLSSDPWALVKISGITFPQADEVALRLGLDMNSPARVRGATLYSCKDGRGMGHLYLSSGDMVSSVRTLVPGADATMVAHALADLHKAKLISVDRTTRAGTTAIYEPWARRMEQSGAELLHQRSLTASPMLATSDIPVARGKSLVEQVALTLFYPEALSHVGATAEAAFKADPLDVMNIAKSALEDWSHGSHVSLAPMQMAGALNALAAPVSILTGLPGTGKTTTLKAVVSVLKDAQVPFLLVAPTGIAAKRMASLTGAPASTIHRAFGAKGWNKGGEERTAGYSGVTGDSTTAVDNSDGSGEKWEYSAENPHPAQVLICDEFSMVDQHLLYRLLSCTSARCRLVFVGDAAQLPSVGAGNVLRDMINSKLFPTVSLTEIFRQGEQSDIVIAAHAIHRGEVPKLSSEKGSDFVLMEILSEDDILEAIVKMAGRFFEARKNFQVLSPRHSGTLGVTNLNQRLRAVLNPKSSSLGEMRVGTDVLREDDRVMVVKNNYDFGIFNGDVGKVARIDRKASEVEIKLHGPPVVHVRLPFKDAAMYLRLAYTMTVHKSQGQEYDLIILPVVKSFGTQLQRNLFYTAITRAKEQVILVGSREAVARAVFNNREDVRNTLFKDRLMLAAVVSPEVDGEGGSVSASVG